MQVQAGPEATSSDGEAAEQLPADRGGIHLTKRLVAVLLVGAMLIFSIISNLTVYLNQKRQMAEARAQITASNEHIADLLTEQERWSDPDYVRAQARARLGWVQAGEVGYQVIDEDGQPYGGGSGIDHTGASTSEDQSWWERIWSSVGEADAPTSAPPSVDDERVVTEGGATPTPGG